MMIKVASKDNKLYGSVSAVKPQTEQDQYKVEENSAKLHVTNFSLTVEDGFILDNGNIKDSLNNYYTFNNFINLLEFNHVENIEKIQVITSMITNIFLEILYCIVEVNRVEMRKRFFTKSTSNELTTVKPGYSKNNDPWFNMFNIKKNTFVFIVSIYIAITTLCSYIQVKRIQYPHFNLEDVNTGTISFFIIILFASEKFDKYIIDSIEGFACGKNNWIRWLEIHSLGFYNLTIRGRKKFSHGTT